MTTIKEKVKEVVLICLIAIPVCSALFAAFEVLVSFLGFHIIVLEDETHYFKLIYDFICPFFVFYCGKRMKRMYESKEYIFHFQYMAIGVLTAVVYAFKLCRFMLDSTDIKDYWYFGFNVLCYALIALTVELLLCVEQKNDDENMEDKMGHMYAVLFGTLGTITGIVAVYTLAVVM